eukprot:6409627-Prymnesium_polylepis.1
MGHRPSCVPVVLRYTIYTRPDCRARAPGRLLIMNSHGLPRARPPAKQAPAAQAVGAALETAYGGQVRPAGSSRRVGAVRCRSGGWDCALQDTRFAVGR